MDQKLWKKILNENTLVTEGVSSQALKSYLETALWSSGDGDLENLDDKYGIRDVDKSALNQAKKDLTKFFAMAKKYIQGERDEKVAHDFWLTRNGHGAGFWDGNYEYGDELTKLSKKFGEINPYVGDDGKIYF